MTNIDEAINFIINSKDINLDKSFEYSKLCSKLLRDKETESLGRRLIINIIDNWKKLDENTYEVWIDLIEAEGFYPYLEKEKLSINSTASAIRKEMSKSKNLDYYLHDEQQKVKNLLDSGKNVIVSAPTSFGKSLLIEELVAEKKYFNIVIIQPTLALLDETRKKLKKYSEDYHIIVRTSQEASIEKRNLFLLTAERVMEYFDMPTIDLLIIDEFYKLSANRDDERSDVLNNAFHMLLKRDNVKFYLLGPNIDKISDGFEEKYNAEFFKTDYSLVEQIVEEMHEDDFKNKEYKEEVLFNLLLTLSKNSEYQTMIYCSSPNSARNLAQKFLNFISNLIDEKKDKVNLIEWIEKNVSQHWMLINCLKYGIAFHDGALQKHIASSVIKYFNKKKLNFLFCTSTIIEGVNTSAKNIIIFDKHKGLKQTKNIIDFFDYSNIKGRAGRMMEHYVGRVYNFNEPFTSQENLIVDIPFFEQKPIKDEVLIHLEDEDILDKDSEQYKELNALPDDEKELFKRNGVLVDGQKAILKKLRKDIVNKRELMLWNRNPNYEQLKYILYLAWDFLIKDGETTFPMTKGNLVRVTYWYERKASIKWLLKDIYDSDKENKDWVKKNKNRLENYVEKLSKEEKKDYKAKNKDWKRLEANKALLKLDNSQLIDKAIQEAFNILRHWFQYKVPKWLRTIHTLQDFVCLEKNLKSGNYLYYANKVESDFIRDNLSILAEYGIPKSAINKIEKYVNSKIDENEVVNLLKNEEFIRKIDFIDYEKEKIKDSI